MNLYEDVHITRKECVLRYFQQLGSYQRFIILKVTDWTKFFLNCVVLGSINRSPA